MTMTNGAVAAGWRRLWRAQRVLWWVFALNLIVGGLSALVFGAQLGPILDHSLHAQRLYHGFDVAAYLELAMKPEVNFTVAGIAAAILAFAFLVFMLFLAGGILESYVRDQGLRTGEFFQACGAYFWRMLRLMIWMLVVIAPIQAIHRGLTVWSDKLATDSPRPLLGFWVQSVAVVGFVLLMMCVRLWFDMAQVRTVAENERGMTRNAGRAFRLTFGNFGSLFWMYFRISLIAWIVLAAGLLLGSRMSAESTGTKWLLGELVIFVWIATRLWQRAAETVWYEAHRPMAMAVAPAVLSTAPEPTNTGVVTGSAE